MRRIPSLMLGALLAWGGILEAGSTRSGELFMPQGGGAGTPSGDYIMSSGGLATFYRYFIEVPAGTSRLVIDLFDADVGAGGTGEAAANRDRQRGGSWNTTATYSLRDPSGTVVTTNFTTGNTTSPAGADNAWRTFYDTAVAFGSSQTATVNTATTVTVANPAGTAAGNLLIGIVAVNAQVSVSASAGWTPLSQGNCAGTTNTCRLAIFYRYYDGTGPSVTFSWDGASRKAIAGVLRYSGASGVPTVGTLATGTSNAPTCPSVTTTVPNSVIVRVFAAGDNTLAASPYPAGHTGRYALQLGGGGSDLASGAADTVQAAAGPSGTAAFALTASSNWAAQTIAVAPAVPAAGHWELRVDQTAGGDDLNALGVRAHDGTAGAGGTEIPVYYDSHSQLGVNPDPASPTRSYGVFPYITSGCSCYENDFDYDVGNGTGNGTAPYQYGRVQLWTRSNNNSTAPADRHQDIPSSSLSGNNAWQRDTVNAWTTATDADEYGIWRADVEISTYTVSGVENGNYTNFYMTNYAATTAVPAANPTANAFRVYLASDSGTAPVKPYMKQHVRHVSGPNPPGVGQTQRVRVTVSVVNPTTSAITFSTPSNVVTARVPGAGTNGTATYVGGSRQLSQGSWVSSELADGGTGDMVWNPGTVAAGSAASMAWDVYVTPSATPYSIPVVGTVASGNGTRGQWLDETGNASQARATYLFGPLCELTLSGSTITEAWVSRTWGEGDPRGLVVGWETVSEVGTTGFELYRRDRHSGEWAKVHDGLLLAMQDAPQGGIYRFLDREVTGEEAEQYALIEVTADGHLEVIGPFEVRPGPELHRGGFDMPDSNFTREPRRAAPGPQGAVAAFSTGLDQAPPMTGAKAIKVGVDTLALYAVPTSALAASGTVGGGRSGVGTSAFAVTNRGLPVATTLSPAKDAILFVGEGIDSVYTNDNVYRLTTGLGSSMATLAGVRPSGAQPGLSFRATVHAEEDRFPATVVAQDPAADYWYWEYLQAGSVEHGRRSFSIQALDLASGAATLQVHLFGASTSGVVGEHVAVVRVNGAEVGRTSWQGMTGHTAVFAVPSGRLVEGSNTIEVEAQVGPGAPYSIFYVDAFDLAYPRFYRARGEMLLFTGDGNRVVTVSGFADSRITVFDVTTPRTAKIVANTLVEGRPGDYRVTLTPASPTARYLAVSQAGWRTPTWTRVDTPSSLRTPGAGAEYVVIAGNGLLRSAQELAARRQSEGMTTLVASVEDVMDEFSYGITDPTAIRSFLRYAWQNWTQRPRYVVLAGAGHLDYRNRLGFGESLVPPLMVATPWGLFASDNALADLVGNDGLPDVAIGRLPAGNAFELDAMIAKLAAYEGGGSWAARAVFAADVAQGANFAADSERLVATAPAGYSIDSIHLGELPIDAARSRLFADLQAGVGLVNYVGHGGLDRLSSQGLLTSDDVPLLARGVSTPLFVTLTCTVNRFELPQYPCLGQTLMAKANGGAAAVWGPSGLSDNGPAVELGARFLAGLGGSDTRVGDAVLAALRSSGRALADIYNLLGDPAMKVQVPLVSTPGGGGTGGE